MKESEYKSLVNPYDPVISCIARCDRQAIREIEDPEIKDFSYKEKAALMLWNDDCWFDCSTDEGEEKMARKVTNSPLGNRTFGGLVYFVSLARALGFSSNEVYLAVSNNHAWVELYVGYGKLDEFLSKYGYYISNGWWLVDDVESPPCIYCLNEEPLFCFNDDYFGTCPSMGR